MTADDPVVALMRAGFRVREGAWIGGGPSHVFAELVRELEGIGWHVAPIDEPEELVPGDIAVPGC